MKILTVTVWLTPRGSTTKDISKYARYTNSEDMQRVHRRLLREAFVKYPDAQRVKIEWVNKESVKWSR